MKVVSVVETRTGAYVLRAAAGDTRRGRVVKSRAADAKSWSKRQTRSQSAELEVQTPSYLVRRLMVLLAHRAKQTLDNNRYHQLSPLPLGTICPLPRPTESSDFALLLRARLCVAQSNKPL
jgi:hypothetical protein